MAKKDIQIKSLDELETSLLNYRKEIMNLRFQKSMGQLEKPSRIKIVRKEIARTLTQLKIERDKKNA